MDKKMTFTITVKGDVQKLIPAVNRVLEFERKRLRKQKVHFTVERVISDG